MVTTALTGPAASRRRADIAAAIVYGVAGVAILSLQPLAFGPLVASGVLTESQLGTISGLETAGVALASAVLPGWLSRSPFRAKLAMLALVMLGCNLLTPHLFGFGALVPIRLLCGLAEGGILAGAFIILFHRGDPDRMNALFLAASNIVVGSLSYMIPMYILPAFGAPGPFLLMAGLGVAALLAITRMAHQPQVMAMPVSGWRTWPAATWLVLLGIVLQNAGVLSAWVFLESTARAAGYGSEPLALSASLGIFAQVAGAATVVAYGYRLPAGRTLMLGGAVMAGSILWLGHPGSAAQFILANVVMGFFWLAMLPLSIKLVCEIERQHQALYVTAAAQMLGLSLGPLLSSRFVSDRSVEPAYWSGCILAVLAILAFAVARNSPDRIKRL